MLPFSIIRGGVTTPIVLTYDTHHWNWLGLSLCDVALFKASCISLGLEGEMKWPHATERRRLLDAMNPLMSIGIIDGTLVDIHKPWKNETETTHEQDYDC